MGGSQFNQVVFHQQGKTDGNPGLRKNPGSDPLPQLRIDLSDGRPGIGSKNLADRPGQNVQNSQHAKLGKLVDIEMGSCQAEEPDKQEGHDDAKRGHHLVDVFAGHPICQDNADGHVGHDQ